jgi:hypothetical protein
MEKKVFEALGYNLAKPLPIHFLRRFVKAADPIGDRQYTAAKYFMELASVDYELTKYRPSLVSKTVEGPGNLLMDGGGGTFLSGNRLVCS